MCTPLRWNANFEVIGAPGDRQLRRYVELFVVALIKRGLREPLWPTRIARMRPEAF